MGSDLEALLERAYRIVDKIRTLSANHECRESLNDLEGILNQLRRRSGKDPPIVMMDMGHKALTIIKLLVDIFKSNQ